MSLLVQLGFGIIEDNEQGQDVFRLLFVGKTKIEMAYLWKV